MDRIRVLIVDDHTLFRTGIRKMLEAEADMHVVGEAATGREALDQARTLVPDVVLMDIKMPDPSASLRTGSAGSDKALDGIAAARILHREMPTWASSSALCLRTTSLFFLVYRRVAGAIFSRTMTPTPCCGPSARWPTASLC